jgi:hypothetical protein
MRCVSYLTLRWLSKKMQRRDTALVPAGFCIGGSLISVSANLKNSCCTNEAPELASIETVCVTAAHCLVRAIRAACRLARSPSSSSAILRNHRPRHEHLELFSIGDASLSVRKNAPQRCD